MSRTRGASRASHGPHTSPGVLGGHCDPPALDRAECGWETSASVSPPLLSMTEYCPKTWQMRLGGVRGEGERCGSQTVSWQKNRGRWPGKVIIQLWN